MISLADESTESLLQRRAALDYLCMGCAMNGVPVPEPQMEEFLLVQAELARRQSSAKILGPRSWTDWLGLKINGYLLNELICDGDYAFVIRGRHEDNQSQKVFKIAKDLSQSGLAAAPITLSRREPYPTQALKVAPFETCIVEPNTDELCLLQVERLCQGDDKTLVRAEESNVFNGREYFRMPDCGGTSLRQLLDEPDSLSFERRLEIFLELLDGLVNLYNQPDFPYHGDIKPDNIMVHSQGVTLIDPGYFGSLLCATAEIENCLVSTPQYCPFLEIDDLLAVGILAWELLLNKHPFAGSIEEPASEAITVGQSVVDLVHFRNSLLQPYLTPLLSFTRPSLIIPDLWPPKLEEFFLQALRLSLDSESQVQIGEGFTNFSQMRDCLEDLEPHLGELAEVHNHQK
jgi:serine/threonine protein kinase